MSSKNEMIAVIKYFLAKKGRRLTNLKKAPLNKLKEIIIQYDINVDLELKEMKIKLEEYNIKYEKEKEERLRNMTANSNQ